MISFKWRHFQKKLFCWLSAGTYHLHFIEQDHRGIKRITKPMMGLKAFHSTEATLAGIEFYDAP